VVDDPPVAPTSVYQPAISATSDAGPAERDGAGGLEHTDSGRRFCLTARPPSHAERAQHVPMPPSSERRLRTKLIGLAVLGHGVRPVTRVGVVEGQEGQQGGDLDAYLTFVFIPAESRLLGPAPW